MSDKTDGEGIGEQTGKSRAKRLAIFGGTFDPIHFGHLRLLVELQEALTFDQIKVIPCRQPALKAQPMGSNNHRIEMIRLALQELELTTIDIDPIEMDRSGPSYSVDTLQALRQQAGPDASITFIMGYDSYLSFSKWHRADEIVKLAHRLVINRPGYDDQHAFEENEENEGNIGKNSESLWQQPAGATVFFQTQPMPISSSQIRALIENQKSPQCLIPTAVYRYIQTHDLYHTANS